MPATGSIHKPVMCYEELLDGQIRALSGFKWPAVQETDPAGLCYTSGTTGNPKVSCAILQQKG